MVETLLINKKILIVDDNPEIHEDFKKILSSNNSIDKSLSELEAELLGEDQDDGIKLDFQIESAFQGQEALEAIRKAKESGVPYSLAFVDVRMPPGWNGIESIAKFWEVDPKLEIVICSAYSDHTFEDITHDLTAWDKFLILKKPFDPIVVQQLALSLSHRWSKH